LYLSLVQDSESLAVEDPVQLAGHQTIVLELTAGVFAEVVMHGASMPPRPRPGHGGIHVDGRW
jgi:hypothetical protein